MGRRGFLKKSAIGMTTAVVSSLLEHPALASVRKSINQETRNYMKIIMIIDGGPKRNMNTAQMRAFLERLAFPCLSYNDYSLTAPKRMPVVLIETMNGKPMMNNSTSKFLFVGEVQAYK